MDATIVLAKCPKVNRIYGVRLQKEELQDIWHETWAFPIDEKRAAAEGYDATSLDGGILIDSEYPGCPYCGGRYHVFCNTCGKPTCWNEKEQMTCAWCGSQITDIAFRDNAKFHFISGNDI